MRKLIVGAIAILTATCVSTAAEPDKTMIAARAQMVLQTHCYRCHGQDGVFEGGMNYILDPVKLVGRKKIVPGRPDESPLYLRVIKGSMPPADQTSRPSPADKDILKQWIAAGAPSAADHPIRSLITQADLFRWMLDDLETMERRSRRFVRYFSLAHLYNQGLSDDELQTYRNALSKLANSLSWHPKVSVPQAVDPNKVLLRIDLRWYTWDANQWNRLLAEYPYGVLDDGVTTRAVMVGTATKLPVLRADWFIANASRPPLYFDMLQLPASLTELERQLRVDAAVDIQQERVARLGFNGSGVSKNNRILERHDSIHGAYWRTYDFEAVPQNLVERGGLLPDQRNIFAYPLGPAGVAPHDPFLHAGGEAIFSLPNGLHGFMIVNNANNRIDKGPVQIVSDPKRPDRAVETGVSCMSCHLTGINPKTDQVRDSLAKNPKAFSRTEAEIIRALYPPEPKMTKLMQEDMEAYRKAIERTGTRLGKTEPVSTLTLRYEADVDLPAAAAEAGLEPEDFRTRISGSELLTRNLGALRVTGGTVSRQVFVQAFGDIVRDLKLGTLFAANINGGTLPDNTGDLDPLEGSASQANAVAFTRDGRLALIATADRSLKLWDIGAEREVKRFVGHSASVWSVAFSRDERFALSGSMDGTMRLWDAGTGQELKRFEGHLTLVAAVAFSADGSRVASGGYDGSVVLWNISGQELKRFDGVARYVHALAFSPDGKYLLAGGDKLVHLLDVESGKEAKSFPGHTAAVSCVAFSPDGKFAASGSDDSTVRVWDVAGGTMTREFQPQSRAPIRDVAFSPRGSALITAGADRSVRLWDIAGNKQAARFDKHGDVVIRASFINGGKQTMSASRDSAIKSWGISKHQQLVVPAETPVSTNAPQSPSVASLKATAVIPIGGTIGNMIISPNHKWLFLIDRSNDKLIQVDTSTRKVTRSWNLPDGCEVFTLTHDGKSIWTIVPVEGGKTDVIEIDPIALTVRKKFRLNLSAYDVAGTDQGLLFLSGDTGGWTDIAVVDAKRQAVVGRWGGVWTRSLLGLSPDQSRLYTSSQGVNPGKVEGFPIPVKLGEKPTPSAANGSADGALGGPFTITPDGRFLIARTGATLKLGTSREEDLQPGPKLPPHLACAADPDRGVLLLLSANGAWLKRYSYPELQWQADYRLVVLAQDLSYDGKQARLYVSGIDPAAPSRPRARGFGDVHIIDLKDLPPGKP